VSDYPTCYVDEIRLDEPACYVLTPWNGEVQPHLVNERARVATPAAKVVWWNLEMMSEDPNRDFRHVDEVAHLIDAIWVSDRTYQAHHPKFAFVPMGSHAGLRECEFLLTRYDFVHMSYAWGRRESLYAGLRERWREGPNGWGRERAETLASSRLLLNVHQREFPYVAPLRFALAAAYELPLLTETVHDGVPHLEPGRDYEHAPYEALPALVDRFLAEPGRLVALGRELHHQLCVEWPFRRGVDEAVAGILA
jgi:hypothetical protein